MNLADLKAEARWLCHKDKRPLNARNGNAGSSTDPTTWAPYAVAVATAKRLRLDGVGIVFTGDALVGIDLDKCIGDSEGTTAKYAKHLIAMTRSYIEISPSGRGLHIIGTGKIPRAVKEKLHGIGVEVYNVGRYFTWTGDVIEGEHDDIDTVQDVIDDIFDAIEYAKPAKPAVRPYTAQHTADGYVGAVWSQWLHQAVTKMSNAISGERHNTRVKMGRLLGGALAAVREAGFDPMSDDDAIAAVYDALAPDEGEEEKEFAAIRWGFEHGLSAPLDIPAPPAPPMESLESLDAIFGSAIIETAPDEVIPSNPEVIPTIHLTDLGNGLRFVEAVKDRVCYVQAWGQWMVWNGKYWEASDDIVVRKVAHAVVIDMYKAAVKDNVLDSELAKWALKSETAARISAMIGEAQPYLCVSASEFDTRHDYLNIANGIVDLRTGDIIPHDKTWRFTKYIDIAYDTKADRSVIDGFMATITANDLELSQYIKRAAGYSMTGRTDEHCLFFAYGNGKNGKSTFMNMLSMVMGDYATTTSVEALLDVKASGEGASPYMARLPGKRLAMAQEMPEGRRMNESLVKSITGGDRIATRGLYKDVFEFTPTHTLWVSGNHKPRIAGTDDGIWRRLRILPFTTTIPEAQRRDSRVIEVEFYAHRTGILRWLIEGAKMWYKIGLGSCKAVDEATAEYRGEEDAVARFIAERCDVGPTKSVSKALLYAAWREWAEDEGDKAAFAKSQRWLLRQLGVRWDCATGGHGGMSVNGIALRPDHSDADEYFAPTKSDREILREMPMQ
jgi:putative DNA primase/helicase